MADLKVSQDKRILTNLKAALVTFGKQGVRCCELVADYMALWPIKTDHKIVISDLSRDLGLSESRIYQMWKAGTVSPMLLDNVEKLESHLRPLAPLVKRGEEVVREAWAEAQKIAEEAGEPLKAEHVEEAVDKRRSIAAVTDPVWTPEGPIRACIVRLHEICEKMDAGNARAVVNQAMIILESTFND